MQVLSGVMMLYIQYLLITTTMVLDYKTGGTHVFERDDKMKTTAVYMLVICCKSQEILNPA